MSPGQKRDLLVLGYDSTPGLHARPDLVLYPTSNEQVVSIMQTACEEGLPVTPRGSGTGLSGGSIPVRGGIVLCLNRMNRILEIDEANLTATCQAGVVTLDLFNAVAARGLFYPPDPGSQKISTLAGNVMEDAGGLRGLKYGVTRDYVMALQCVLPDGSLLTTGGKARQGCRRLRVQRPAGRFGRNPRGYHRGHGQADPAAADQAHVSGLLR